MLQYKPHFFHWAGTDLFPVVSESGQKKMVVLETNSCPSGQKYMPSVCDENPMRGYEMLVTEFLRAANQSVCAGALAVIFDKNVIETKGYAETLAAVSGEPVHLVEWYLDDPNPPVKYIDQIMHVRDASDQWCAVRAAFRYLTQKPWNRLPLHSKTVIFNPIQACLVCMNYDFCVQMPHKLYLTVNKKKKNK